MKCDIQWNSLSLLAWNERFNSISRSNFLQSYTYAQGASKYYRQKVRWGLIFIDGKEAGLVQVFEAGLFFKLFHAVIIDRGPLWFNGYGNAPHVQAFIKELQNQFPKRWGRKRRFLPEIEDGMAAQALIKQVGLEKNEEQTPYETYWLNLTKDREELRARLDGKWRNALVKSEKLGLTIEWDDKGAFYKWIRAEYALDKTLRGYSGITPQLLDNLAPFLLKNNSMLIGRAILNGESIAGIVVFLHGRSATYEVGWTSEQGRAHNAHHLLLWRALFVLQNKSIKEFDLGGINNDTAEGIKKFKKGMGGDPYRLVGHYT